MLEIDLKEINKYILSLNNLIKECEEVELNLFKELDNSTTNWQDNKSLLLADNIISDKEETFFFIEKIKERHDILEYIYDSYIKIGNKIKCDINRKTKIINILNNILNEINVSLKELSRLNYQIYIEKIQKELIVIEEELISIKAKIANLFNRINNFETSINAKINKLDNIKINNIGDYNE